MLLYPSSVPGASLRQLAKASVPAQVSAQLQASVLAQAFAQHQTSAQRRALRSVPVSVFQLPQQRVFERARRQLSSRQSRVRNRCVLSVVRRP